MFKRLCVVVCLVVIPIVSKAVVTVENGSYQNVQITFAPNVAVDNNEEIIQSLKDLLQNTSNTLQNAVGLHIKNVLFRLPATWDVSGWENVTVEAASKGVSSSDIWVDATQQNAFGINPFAVQYGGCGVPGEKITIPVDFLNSQGDYPKGKLLAREWLKYRYGVFDENGFHEDLMYPAYYQIPGTTEVHITECTNAAVKYDYKDTNGTACSLEIPFASEDCQILVDEQSSENVTSSLLYFHQGLRNMEHVCGTNHSHNAEAPNKQNTLCAGQSIWDVLKRSSDFQKLPNEAPTSVAEVQFTFVQETKPRVVIAWENSDNLNNEKVLVPFGVRRLLYDLPVGSKIALYSFNDEVTTVLPLQEVPDVRRVDISSSFVEPEVHLPSAVEEIVEVLVSDNAETEGSLILIAGSESPGEVSEDLRKKLDDSKLCVTIVVFVEREWTEVEKYKTLFSDLRCSYLLQIPHPVKDEEKAAAFENLYQAMRKSWPQAPTETRTSTVTTGFMSPASALVIPHDPSVENFTLWLEGGVESRNINCTSGEHDVILESLFPPHSVSGFTFKAVNDEVQCVWKIHKLSPALTQVQSTTRPGEYFNESGWVHDTTEKGVDDQMPVIIYARINHGNYPIRNAVVTANVTGPSGQELESFLLFDNGKGDPDITQNDGIYSRYYMKFEEEGVYNVLVTFESDGNQTSIGKNGSEKCCGSQVRSEATEGITLRRTFQIAFHAKAKKQETVYKPSRVIDLRVDTFDSQNRVLLKWTAPGGEYDRGKAKSYNIKSFSTKSDAVTEFNSTGRTLISSIQPGDYGADETYEIRFENMEENNMLCYVALRSTNEGGAESEISNVVTFFIPETPVTTIDPGKPDGNGKQSGVKKETIGIIIGVLVLVIVLVVCAYLAFYFFVRKPGKAKENKKTVESDRPQRPTGCISLNSIPADVILKHHNEVVSAKSQHRDPPIFKEENLEAVGATAPKDADSEEPKYSQVQKNRDPEPAALKSPKRMTNV